MKASEDSIRSVGLALLYEPDEPNDPVVDIILVHGIGGHPVRSWKTTSGATPLPPTPSSTIHLTTLRRKLKKSPPTSTLRRSNSEPLLSSGTRSSSKVRSLLRKNSFKSSSRLRLELLEPPETPAAPIPELYWPLDFLPSSCPTARVFTWGYHTLRVDNKPLPLQNDVFAHATELLEELAAARAASNGAARPIIFIAHSTGGVIVKELLRLSELERDGPLKEIILSTSGVVFFGSPHRATEHCTLVDAIKSMAGATSEMDPQDPVLQQLSGANSLQAELGRQTFVRLWNDFNFRVKTFQESIIPTYRFRELRVEATIRRLASFIGDPRENAETIGALHGDLCKFASPDDHGYRALASTLSRMIESEEEKRHVLSSKETECLAALVRPHVALSETHPATTYPGTCLWLYDLHEFASWHHRSDNNKNKILWIKGQSGCGKTILLRSLRRRLERQWAPAGATFIWTTAEGYDTTSTFFPGTSRQQHEVNPANVYRSLLAQLFLQDPSLRKALLTLYSKHQGVFDDALIVSFFADDYIDQRIQTPTRRTFLFVDIADDACPAYVEELVCRLSQLARNSDFNICVASAVYHDIEEANTISIVMHSRNTDDILRYVNLNLVAEWEERNQTVMRLGQKAGGVFLWAEIVVNILNAAITEGASQELIEYTVDELPGDLHGLYEWMLSTLNETERAESLTLFQWAILGAEPMRLNDLFVAIRLTDPAPLSAYDRLGPFMALHVGPPSSLRDLRQLRNSEITSDTPYQFHRWLRARSIGLLELKSDTDTNEPLGLQRIQPIHSSVRTFFLSGRGFACLAASTPCATDLAFTTADYLDLAHYSLLAACLRYLNMRDFEHLTSTTTPVQTPTTPVTKPFSDNQRTLVLSSYPFLRYAVDNLLFHLLSPRFFRYFFPQREVLLALSANRMRLWKRWTALLGTAEPEEIFGRNGGAAKGLLSPVFGARFRLERVMRTLGRMGKAGAVGAGAVGSPVTPAAMGWSVMPEDRAVGRLPPVISLPVPKRKKMEGTATGTGSRGDSGRETAKEAVAANGSLAVGDAMVISPAKRSMIPVKATKSPTTKSAPSPSANGHARKVSMIPVKSPTSKGSMSPLASPLTPATSVGSPMDRFEPGFYSRMGMEKVSLGFAV
ncbi:hypothetical protein QBC39DRAFT_410291 [Podospora conica]|nr:hypothetical protein QBC39DRAFT_410291 [Schizothecium conicum]